MRLVVLILFIVLLATLAAMNTDFLTYPHTLYLGSATYKNVPMGFSLLVIMLIPTITFYIWGTMTKLRSEAESAKLLREMENLRQSLDAKESKRFEELQGYLEHRFAEMNERLPDPANTDENPNQREFALLHESVDTFHRDMNLQLSQIDDYLKSGSSEPKA